MSEDQQQEPCTEACLDMVRKVYRMGAYDVEALRGVTVSFHRGSFWAIMGPSGSGKSTMLNLLGCLDRPTSGTYTLKGRDVSTLDDDSLSDIRLRDLGFIFQSFNLIPQLTVEENIGLPLYYQGWDPKDSAGKAREMASQLGLGERVDHRPMELSGGQQQRVAIARALVNDPAVILADEPTGNVDSATGEEIMKIICRLNERGKTIIMVTHERQIADYAKCRLYLRDGLIEEMDCRS